MKKIKRIFHLLFTEPNVFIYNIITRCSRVFPDKLYLKWIYKLKTGNKLNLNAPKSFNEKLNWLKLHNRKAVYSIMVDKFKVKSYVATIIGEEYVVPCYGAWDNYDDIDFSQLPNQFVLKTNHDSSGATLCTDKFAIDHNKLSKHFNKLLHRNYFFHLREWPYKDIKPLIIAEKLLVDNTSDRLRDYKFWCFNGKPTYMYCTVKGGDVFENFYDMNFCPINISHGFERHVPEFNKPTQFEKMKELATQLSQNIPFVRIDFFEVDGRLYFGEFTFYDWGGMKPFTDMNMDLQLGELILLPNHNETM